MCTHYYVTSLPQQPILQPMSEYISKITLTNLFQIRLDIIVDNYVRFSENIITPTTQIQCGLKTSPNEQSKTYIYICLGT